MDQRDRMIYTSKGLVPKRPVSSITRQTFPRKRISRDSSMACTVVDVPVKGNSNEVIQISNNIGQPFVEIEIGWKCGKVFD
jgi:hypothetical protein